MGKDRCDKCGFFFPREDGIGSCPVLSAALRVTNGVLFGSRSVKVISSFGCACFQKKGVLDEGSDRSDVSGVGRLDHDDPSAPDGEQAPS